MKITIIKQQLKNADRASIFVDQKYAFSLSLNELVIEKLKIGQILSEPEFKRLKKLSEDGKLKMRTLEWLLNRPRSTRELKDYLFRKKAETEQVAQLIDDFTARGYLSEQKFADWLIDMRRRQNKSGRAIKNELLKKGVDRQIIEPYLKQDEDQELERLKMLVAKKQNLSRYKNDQLKFKQFLMRQGFSYDDIKTVLMNGDN